MDGENPQMNSCLRIRKSRPSFIPNTQPRPIDFPAYEIIASVEGFLMPRPVLSAIIKAAATGQLPANASAGTTVVFRT